MSHNQNMPQTRAGTGPGKRRRVPPARRWDQALLLGTMWLLGVATTTTDASASDSGGWTSRLPWRFSSHQALPRVNNPPFPPEAPSGRRRRTVSRNDLLPRHASSRETQRITDLTSAKSFSASSLPSQTNSSGVKASPFEVVYESDLGIPTDEDFLGAEGATIQHLTTYLNERFDNSTDLILTDVVAAAMPSSGRPATIGYTVTAFFSPSSAVVPSQADVEDAIQAAFDAPAVEGLFLLLDEQPSSSPFSQTWSISYVADPSETSVSLLGHSSKSSISSTSSKSSSSSSESKGSQGPAPSTRPTASSAPLTAVPSRVRPPSLRPSTPPKGSKSKKAKSVKSSKGLSSKSFYSKSLPSKAKATSKSKHKINCPPTVRPTSASSSGPTPVASASRPTTAPSQLPKSSQSPTPGATAAPVPATMAPVPATVAPVPATTSPAAVAPVPATSGPTAGGPSSAPVEGTAAPTPGGSTSAPATSSPAGGGVNVQASPFYIIYDTDLGTPTPADFDAAANITLQHIQDYLNQFFSTSSVSILIDVNGAATGTATNPASIGYSITAVFDPSSDLIPSQSDIDQAINTAFNDPGFQALFEQLDTLPASNPMSQTWGLTYQEGALPAPAYPQLHVRAGFDVKITHNRGLQSQYNIFSRSKTGSKTGRGSSKGQPSSRPVSGPPVATIAVKARPFNATYTVERDTTPTEQDIGEAAGVTQQYLEDFLMRFFQDSGVSILTELDSDEIGSTVSPSLKIEYDVTGVFDLSSPQIPSQADMDLLLEAAFSDPVVQVLLERLKSLPAQNPFATTTQVTIPGGSASSSKSMSPGSSKRGKGSGKGSSRTKRPSSGKGKGGKGSVTRRPSPKGKGKGGKGSSKSSQSPSQRSSKSNKSSKSSKSSNECPESHEPSTPPISVIPTTSPRPNTQAPQAPTASPVTVAPSSAPALSPSSTSPAQSPSTLGPAVPPVVQPTPLIPSATQAPALSPSPSTPTVPVSPTASPALAPSTSGPVAPPVRPPSLAPESTPSATQAPAGGPPTPLTPSAPSATQAPANGPSSPSVGPPTPATPSAPSTSLSPAIGPPTPLTPSAPSATLTPNPAVSISPALTPSSIGPVAPLTAQPAAPSTGQPASSPTSSSQPATPSASQAPAIVPPSPLIPSAPTPSLSPNPAVSVNPALSPLSLSPVAPSTAQPAVPSTGQPATTPTSSIQPATAPASQSPNAAPAVAPPSPLIPSAPTASLSPNPAVSINPALSPSSLSPVAPSTAQPAVPSTGQPASTPTSSIQPATAPASQGPTTAPAVVPPTPLTPSAPTVTLSPNLPTSINPALTPSSVGPAAPSAVPPTSSPVPLVPTFAPSIAPTPGASEITISSAPTPGASTAVPTPGISTISTPAPTGLTLAPTPGSCFSPTDAPFTPPAGTTVEASPFNIDYTLGGTGTPAQADFDEASTTTCQFLREQLCIFFSTNIELTFAGITCDVTSTSGSPVQIGYQVSAVFSPGSVTLPTQAELDIAVASMFSGSVVDDLITNLQTLPASNPFSTTTAAASDFNPVQSNERDPTKSSSSSGLRVSSPIVWLVATIGCSVLLGTAMILGRWRSNSQRNRTIESSGASASREDATMEIMFESRRPEAADEVSQLLFGASFCGSRYGPDNAVRDRERMACEPDGAYLCDDEYWTEPGPRFRR